MNAILQDHWLTYGRNYYTRFDFEGVDSKKAEDVVAHIANSLASVEGQSFSGMTVSKAYVFSYEDPIDGSVSDNQGWCVEFGKSRRFILRCSGTGTVGTTLRLYVETYENDPSKVYLSENEAISSVLRASLRITNLENLTARKISE